MFSRVSAKRVALISPQYFVVSSVFLTINNSSIRSPTKSCEVIQIPPSISSPYFLPLSPPQKKMFSFCVNLYDNRNSMPENVCVKMIYWFINVCVHYRTMFFIANIIGLSSQLKQNLFYAVRQQLYNVPSIQQTAAICTQLNGLKDQSESVSPRARAIIRRSRDRSKTGKRCFDSAFMLFLCGAQFNLARCRFRLSIDYSKGRHCKLAIKSISIEDEDVYSCEVTYLEPLETCDTSGEYLTNLKVVVPPSAIVMTDETGSEIRSGSTIGPLKEGHRLEMTCEVRGARPQPIVGWYRDAKLLASHEDVEPDALRGVFTVKSKLTLNLSRKELSSNIECRVQTTDENSIISNNVLIDLQVRPTKIYLSGVKSHVVEGSKVLLECHVYGGRPAANISWYNSTKLIDDTNLLTTISTNEVRR